MAELKVGELAPEFTLETQAGEPWSLAEQVQQGSVVLFFYPKDNTRVCTAEACQFRDSHAVFVEHGATVVGISSDSVASHQAFAGKHALEYVLLSDPGGRVRAQFGIKKALGLIDGRVTFVIDRERRVQHVFSSMLNAGAHVEEALATVKRLNG
ncbi:MAG: peroxiredoxin [Polyangiaceae bacterium]|nr:peroxiredoxin [Polyangiaceae bacterium]MCW5790353.1 peroxiredoxin [Polyangiaceae bacterium]